MAGEARSAASRLPGGGAARLADHKGDEGVDRPEGALIGSGRGRGDLEPGERTPETTVRVAHRHIQRATERLDLRG